MRLYYNDNFHSHGPLYFLGLANEHQSALVKVWFFLLESINFFQRITQYSSKDYLLVFISTQCSGTYLMLS